QAVRGAARARNHEDLTLAVVVGTVRVLPEIERAVVTLVDPLPTTTLVRGRWRARERDERVVGGESRVVLEEARVRGAREGRGRAGAPGTGQGQHLDVRGVVVPIRVPVDGRLTHRVREARAIPARHGVRDAARR